MTPSISSFVLSVVFWAAVILTSTFFTAKPLFYFFAVIVGGVIIYALAFATLWVTAKGFDLLRRK